MHDNYSHVDNRLIYVTESVPGAGPTPDSGEYSKLIESFNSQLANGCKCVNICTPPTCDCCEGAGSCYIQKTRTHRWLLNKCKMDNSTSTTSIIECNDMCFCRDNCGNRVVQYGPAEGLYIKSCQKPEKGLGLFTKELIDTGTFICEYAGEIITKTQAILRQEQNTRNGKMNYIFCLNEHNQTNVIQTFVDPSYIGNIGRYINHSCDPNCVIIPVRVNTPIPKLAIFNCRDILPHTEITFQYGLQSSMDTMATIETKVCYCNSSKCTGWMPYDVY